MKPVSTKAVFDFALVAALAFTIHAPVVEARVEVLNASATRPLYAYPRKNLYAIGAGENPNDVITILNGNIHVARISAQKTVALDDSFKTTASKLKYANVAVWAEVPLPPEVKTRDDLNVTIEATLKKFGYENPGTVPFLLKGRFPSVGFHVGEGDARLDFDAKNTEALIVGFFTKTATPSPALSHVFHVVTQPPAKKPAKKKEPKFAAQSGVIDALSFQGKDPIVLFLPR